MTLNVARVAVGTTVLCYGDRSFDCVPKAKIVANYLRNFLITEITNQDRFPRHT